jgi:pimeloyl-ACP methyl ester carboxylesterase
MAQLELNGAKLAYDDTGTGGPVFVFLHGWACDRRTWAPQVADLSKSHRCISLDFRGRGESSPTPPFDTSTAAEDVAALVRELDLGPVVLVGHSLGGLVALLVNYRYPELVVGVVMGDPPLTAASGGGFRTTVERLRESGSTSMLSALMDSFFVEETPPEVRTLVEDMMLKCPTDVAAGMLDNADIFQSSMRELIAAGDKKPFMAIWAATPRGNPERLREVTMFLRQEPMGEAGHFFQLEHPKVTTALLRAFLDDVARDPRVAQGDAP